MPKATSVLESKSVENVSRIRSYADVAFGPRRRVPTVIVGDSRTKQQFKDECDVNVIMRRYQQTGVLPFAERMQSAKYLDVSAVDYQAAMLAVAGARSMFNELPSSLRDRFQNDPKRLLEFLEDDRNKDEAIKLGLVNPPKGDAKPIEVRVVGDPSPVAPAVAAGATQPAKPLVKP